MSIKWCYCQIFANFPSITDRSIADTHLFVNILHDNRCSRCSRNEIEGQDRERNGTLAFAITSALSASLDILGGGTYDNAE